MHAFTHAFVDSFIHAFIHSRTNPSIHSAIHACMHSYSTRLPPRSGMSSSSLCDSPMQDPNASSLAAATESSTVMEREVARLEQVNKDVKAACQGLQATVDDLSR